MSEVTLIISMLPFMIERMEGNKPMFKEGVLLKMNADRVGEPYDEESFRELLITVFHAIGKANKVLFQREHHTNNGEVDPYLEVERLLLDSRKRIFELMEPIEKHAQDAAKEAKKWFDQAGAAIDKEEQRRILRQPTPTAENPEIEEEPEASEDQGEPQRGKSRDVNGTQN